MKEGRNSKVYGKNMPSWLKAVLFALICTLLIVILKECVSGDATASADKTLKEKNAVWNQEVIDSCIGLLKDGDMVIRTGRDITSQMFCKFNQKDQTYSHAGIVSIENGYPYVYHCIGGEDNPDAKLRRDSASFWFSTVHNLGLGICRFDMSAESLIMLKQVVRQYYKERKMFDMGFDLKSDDRLYCAEFVYKAVNRTMNDNTYLQPVTRFGLEYIAIDNLYMNEHTSLICQVRYK